MRACVTSTTVGVPAVLPSLWGACMWRIVTQWFTILEWPWEVVGKHLLVLLLAGCSGVSGSELVGYSG